MGRRHREATRTRHRHGLNAGSDRNAIGAHGGAYSVYRALAVSSGAMAANNRPDLTNTSPTTPMGPFPQWTDASKIVSLDPWGARVAEDFADESATASTSARPSPSPAPAFSWRDRRGHRRGPAEGRRPDRA
jgi:hypothetical protein